MYRELDIPVFFLYLEKYYYLVGLWIIHLRCLIGGGRKNFFPLWTINFFHENSKFSLDDLESLVINQVVARTTPTGRRPLDLSSNPSSTTRVGANETIYYQNRLFPIFLLYCVSISFSLTTKQVWIFKIKIVFTEQKRVFIF